MPVARLKTWNWTVEKFDAAAELGWFDRQRLELLEGKIVRMPPQSEPHVVGIMLAARAVRQAFDDRFTIRTQFPLRLGERSKPEPDIAVVKGSIEDSLDSGTPTSAMLIVEVSDATLWYDRNRKAAAYARHGIADYWIVNLVKLQLEVRRDPIADPTHRFGHRYASTLVLKPPAAIAPLAAPSHALAVADLLPWRGVMPGATT